MHPSWTCSILCHRYFLFLPRHLSLLAPTLISIFQSWTRYLFSWHKINPKSTLAPILHVEVKVNEISRTIIHSLSHYPRCRKYFLDLFKRFIANLFNISSFIYKHFCDDTLNIFWYFKKNSIFRVSKNYRNMRNILYS